MNPHRISSLLLFLSSLSLLFAASLFSQRVNAPSESEEITEVVVEGNSRVADRRVFSAAHIEIGDHYSMLLFRDAMKNLWATGLYQDIEILTEPSPEGGLKVIIRIKEAPIISKLELVGNKKLKDEDIKDKIPLRVGGLYSQSKVVDASNKISELYQNEGYYNSQIEIDSTYATVPGRIEITYNIDEGSKIKITDIVFDGNKNFEDGKLRGVMDLKQASVIKFWRRGGYDEEKFQKDITENLPTFYQKNGFINMQVMGHDFQFDSTSNHVTLKVNVDEGQQFFMGNIGVSGNAHYPDNVITSSFELNHGDVFNEVKFDEGMQKVRETYGDEGYIYLQAQPIREYEDSLININLMIREGDPASIRKIIIKGNEQTFEKVIRRRISIYPGDLFRQPLVKASYNNLVNSGFFEQDIGVEPKPVEEGGEVDLLFRVKEKRTGSANFGAGFGGGYGVTGFLDLTQSNLFGRGKSATIRLEFGTRMTNIDLNYRDPFFMDSPISLDVGVFNMRRKLQGDPYEDRYKGFYTRFGFPIQFIDDNSRFYVGYTLRSIDIVGDSAIVALYTGANISDYPQTSSKVSFTVTRDTRVNLQHPQGGSKNSVTAEYSGGPFGGNIGYQKYEFDSSWYVPTFFDSFILGLKMRGGALQSFGGSSSPIIDPWEKYILGGTGYGRDTDIQLRGYDDRTVGVDGRHYTRGQAFFLVTAEEEIKITNQVYAVLFLEAGNVWRNVGDINVSDLRRSAGFGVRMETPMGPLGLEMGYGFDRTDSYGISTGGGWQPHFRFGSFY